jgi:hypothetical protein
MTSKELRAALQSVPFRPFTIHMADGRAFEVRHQDFLLLGPNGRTAFAFSPSGADFSILDVMLMTEIKFGQQETQAATNATSDQP